MTVNSGVDYFLAANQSPPKKLIETCPTVCANLVGDKAAKQLPIQGLFYHSFEGSPT